MEEKENVWCGKDTEKRKGIIISFLLPDGEREGKGGTNLGEGKKGWVVNEWVTK